MRPLSEAFANDVTAALDVQGGRRSWLLLSCMAAGLAAAGVWAHYAVLDEVTHGEGKVIPSSHVQIVQPLEGGIVAAIMVREGQQVKPGDPLVRIDDTSFASSLGELEQRRMALAVRKERLSAEADGRVPDFAQTVATTGPIAIEAALFRSRQASLEQEAAVARQQHVQRTLELEEVMTKLAETRATAIFVGREVGLGRSLKAKGAFPEMELLRLERQNRSEQREVRLLEAALPRVRAAISESAAKLESLRLGFKARASEQLAETIANLAVTEQTIRAAEDRVRRSILRAPAGGIVNKLNVTTIGAVVRPGESVVEIVPNEDNLLVEARIRPQDIAFIRPGQPASIKVTAYDYTIYGDLPGVVERIGADTLLDEKQNAFYRVIIKTSRTGLGRTSEQLPIMPGMVVSADIQTGRKSVLDYLTRPIHAVRSQALRER